MSQTIEFTKGQGTGNDFVLIFDPTNSLSLSPAQIARICDRNFGIGADGLIRIVPSSFIEEGRSCLEVEPNATWFMDYYNADGSVAEMCGNGARVFARYLTQRVLTLDEAQTLSIATRAGVKDIQKNMAGFAVNLGRWALEGEHTVKADQLDVARPGQAINVGNPHIVVALSSEEELASLSLATAPRPSPPLESGANIEFVVPAEPMVKEGVGYISMRVYERGVGETLSCGTGIVAAALATRHWAGQGAPNQWQVRVAGGVLGVRMFDTEEGEMVGLSGAAELVFDGSIDLDSL